MSRPTLLFPYRLKQIILLHLQFYRTGVSSVVKIFKNYFFYQTIYSFLIISSLKKKNPHSYGSYCLHYVTSVTVGKNVLSGFEEHTLNIWYILFLFRGDWLYSSKNRKINLNLLFQKLKLIHLNTMLFELPTCMQNHRYRVSNCLLWFWIAETFI